MSKKVEFMGNPVELSGDVPAVGQQAPDFVLTKNDLSDFSLKENKGKVLVLSVVPSLDTKVCAASARMFNKRASDIGDVLVLNISEDLPFAAERFCVTEGLKNVIALSDFRDREFGNNYGLLIKTGPLRGLLARAVIVIDKQGKIVYEEVVSEITNEPNYDLALAAAKSASV